MLESSKNKAPRIRGRYRVAKRVPPKIKLSRFSGFLLTITRQLSLQIESKNGYCRDDYLLLRDLLYRRTFGPQTTPPYPERIAHCIALIGTLVLGEN